MRLAVDFDGVLGHTLDLFGDEFNIRHPTKPITVKDMDIWDFWEKPNIAISKDEAFDIFDFCWKHWELIKPMEVDQIIKMERLMRLGTVDIVTSVVKNKESIEKWLKKYKIPFNELVFAQEKWNLNYDVFIDDSPVNAKHISELDKNCLIYDQYWNRHVSIPKTTRVYSLAHAYDLLEVLK